jgi:hypothetical protein
LALFVLIIYSRFDSHIDIVENVRVLVFFLVFLIFSPEDGCDEERLWMRMRGHDFKGTKSHVMKDMHRAREHS